MIPDSEHRAPQALGDATPLLILHLIVDLRFGGAELMLKRLVLAEWGERAVRHVVISLRNLGPVGAELQAAGVQVEALGIRTPLDALKGILTLRRRIRELRPDVVQSWMYHADLIGGIASRLSGNRAVIWNVRATVFGANMGASRFTPWIRRACALVSRHVPARIIYVAHSARELHERLGYDRHKGLVIPNGYVPGARGGDGWSLRREIGIGDDVLLVGSAGRFDKLKDHRTFVEACARLAAAVPTAQFVLAGTDVDWQNPELAAWIDATGLRSRFHLLGHRNDIAACLSQLDVFCLHSISEAFPNVVAEAMAQGVPCVVTDVGDAKMVVAETGKVVPPSSPDILASALAEVLEMPVEHRRALGIRGRERILENFSMEAVRARYEAVYRATAEACSGNGTAPAVARSAGTSSQPLKER